MFRSLLAASLIISLTFSSVVEGIFAYEGEAVNSLESLPYANPVEERVRESLLDNPSLTETTREKTISFEKREDNSLVTLLADKRSFEQIIPLAPTFSGVSLDPFAGLFAPSQVSGSGAITLPIITSDIVSTGALFTDTLPSRTIHIDRSMKKQESVSSIRGALTVLFSTGTTISTLSGDLIDPTKIGFLPLGTSEKVKAKAKYEKGMKNRGSKKKGQSEAQVEGFEFGLSGTHLIFSSPVALTIDVLGMTDGNAVDIMTMHAGDADFHTGGLSVSPNTLCNTDGTASIPGSQAIVKNGKVTFYTCGASSFTMNPTGGTAGSNDLRLVIGDCGQFQLYYSGSANIYTGNPPATGCSNTMDAWFALAVGATTYGSDWTAWSTNTMTGTTNGNSYTGKTILTRVRGGLTYTVNLDWRYTAPNKYFNIDWSVNVPTGNTSNVRFYIANDSMVSGGDVNDTGYSGSAPSRTVGVYDSVANQTSAIRYISGLPWTAEQANGWNTVRTQITGGANFTNAIQTTSGDLGFGVNWDFGTTVSTYTGTIEWRLIPYSTGSVVDLIPGIGASEGPLTSNLLSQLPITISNAGSLSSSGTHTVVLTIPTNIVGPASAFTDNGWSCGAQVGTGVTCTKTTSVTGSLVGNETVRIPVTPNTTASGTNVTFSVTVSNSGDSNIGNNTATSTNFVVGGVSTSPGGVVGATLWLRGGNGTNCTTTGCTITTWANSGTLGATANAVTGLGTVTYDPTNRINGNPTIYFNGASLNTNSNLNVTTAAASLFTVTSMPVGGSFLMGTQSGTANGLSSRTSVASNSFGLFGGVTFFSGASSRSASRPSITTMTRSSTGLALSRTDGLQTLLSGSVATAFATSNIGIGRTNTTNSTLSNVGEVIVYPTTLTGTAQRQVESYLAIKYGITLDQTTAADYIYSNGTIVWNATTAGGYNKNITGIGRDDTSTLSQLRSQSVTSTGDIIVSKSSIGTNRMALMWANDGASTATFTGTDAPTGYQRMVREWLFQEKNGDLANVTVSYPAGAIGTGFTAPLYLLADTDSTFATGAIAYTGSYSTGTNTWDFTLNIADMQYVAFAKAVPTDTTPPVILSNSVASGTLAPSGTFPITITYSDTGSAISPATLTGKIYAWDATGATWSPTNIAGPYLSITSASTATGVFQLTGLPFGKYRFDFSIADTVGNTVTQSYTYYVDSIIWTISAPSYDIGPAQTSIQTFGTGELLLTVQTVGAGFDLSMLRTADMTYLSDTITVYSGSTGWGYDKNIGSGYSSTITAHGTTQTIVSTAKNINTNGQRNTFVYRIKFGVNASANTPAGDYMNGLVRFGINLSY